MARNTFMVPPKTRQPVVVEEWLVVYVTPQTGRTVEVTIFCARGQFFAEFRHHLAEAGLDSQDFDVEQDTWTRQLLREHPYIERRTKG